MRSSGRITTKRRAVAGYTAVPASGGSANAVPANWFAATLAFVQTQVQTLVNPIWTAEFSPNPSAAEIDIALATGTGTAVLSTSAAGGAIDLTSGATANSLRLFRNKNGTIALGNYITPNMSTGIWAVSSRAKPTTVNATSDLVMCGISDETVLTSWLGTHGATSATNYVTSTTSVVDTGTAFTLGTYVDLLWIADGTNLTAYLGTGGMGSNYVAIGSPRAQNVLPTNPGHFIAYAGNNATASNCACSIDRAMAITTNAS